MSTNGSPTPVAKPPAAPSRLWLGAAFIGLVLMIPIFVGFVIFPLFQQQAFESLDELQADSIQSIEVRILVRPEIAPMLANRGDIGPFRADPVDFAELLEPLRAAEDVVTFPDAQGPILGEYRILLNDNRRGTIRLYWDRDPSAPPDSSARLRFKIGSKKYEGGSAEAVVRVAAAAEERGTSLR